MINAAPRAAIRREDQAAEPLPWPPYLVHQWRFFRWRPPLEAHNDNDDDGPPVSVEAFLGGWGTGKSEGTARKFIYLCVENGWRDEQDYDPDDPPVALVSAPTSGILRDVTIPLLSRLMPRSLIRKKVKSPHHVWHLTNGVKILFRSAEAELEGVTAFLAWLDEIHKPQWAQHPARYLNYLARLRDSRSPWNAMLVSGLPEFGWVRDTFDQPDNPLCHVVLAATKDNPTIPRALLDQFRQQCPSGYEETLLGGQWMAPPESIYSQYTPDNLTDFRGRKKIPVHLGWDLGNGAHVVFGQETTEEIQSWPAVPGEQASGKLLQYRPTKQHAKGVTIVDEIHGTNQSADEMCLKIKRQCQENGWVIRAGESTINVDPNTDLDEAKAIRKHFPGVRIVQCRRGDDGYPVEYGIRQVQAALRDSYGNVRLRFWKGLRGNQFGVLDGVTRYRRNPVTQEPVKDNLRDHAIDALRYLVQQLLPLERGHKAKVIKRR